MDYADFMYNPANIFHCEGCPENIDSDSWEGKLPCGQQNCWVECHCDAAYVEEDDYEAIS
jgi:hypothetical protein